MEELNDFVEAAIRQKRKIAIPNQNLHGVYLYHRRPLMRALHDQWDVHVDGMSLVMLGRLLGAGVRREHRVTYIDWMQSLVPLSAAKGWRIFYLGSKEGVAARGAEILRQRYPSLQIATHHGHFDWTAGSVENERVLAEIAELEPHILMVGMGMPLQEEWIQSNWDKLAASVVLPSGAAMDYIAGAVRTAPRWIGRIGLEWLYRLAKEPRRLGRRYLIEPWTLVSLLIEDVLSRIRRKNSSSVCYWNRAESTPSSRWMSEVREEVSA